MKIYDISITVQADMPVWPGDHAVEVVRTADMEKGDSHNLSVMHMGVHTGTHVDAPNHFLKDGSRMDDMPLEVLIGPAQVVVIPDEVSLITAEVLKAADIQPGVQRLLFKTRNTHWWQQGDTAFHQDFVAIAVDAARLLVERGVRLVGLDYLSIAPFGDSVDTHRALLGAGVVLLEGADLSKVPAGMYTLCCLPMKLGAAEGAPARTVLLAD